GRDGGRAGPPRPGACSLGGRPSRRAERWSPGIPRSRTAPDGPWVTCFDQGHGTRHHPDVLRLGRGKPVSYGGDAQNVTGQYFAVQDERTVHAASTEGSSTSPRRIARLASTDAGSTGPCSASAHSISSRRRSRSTSRWMSSSM